MIPEYVPDPAWTTLAEGYGGPLGPLPPGSLADHRHGDHGVMVDLPNFPEFPSLSFAPEDERAMIFEAIETVAWDFERLQDAKTLGEQATAFTALCNSMSDLQTWHPNYDYEVGEILELP